MRLQTSENAKQEEKRMTCVVSLVEPDGTIYLGGDSAVVGSYQLTIRKDKKVFVVNDFLIGCAGSARMRQLLHHAFVPPEYVPGADIDKYMATDFIDAVRQCLKDGGFAQKKDEQEEIDGVFLVGFHGRLFRIATDYQHLESLDGYDAIGSGAEVALGVLFAIRDLDMLPRQRLELALKAAEHHIASVQAPFTILEHPAKGTETSS